MPPAVGAVASFVGGVVGTITASGSLALFAAKTTAALIYYGGSAALFSAASRKLAGKPTGLDVSDVAPEGRLVQLRSTHAPRDIVYGTARKAGVVVFLDTSGTNNKYLWQVIAIAGHEIDSWTTIHLDDRSIAVTDINGSDEVTDTRFIDGDGNKLLKIWMYDGTDSQTANTTLATDTDWSSNHRLRGVAYLVLRMEVDASEGGSDPDNPEANVWSAGPPNTISATIKGKKIYDPRLDGTNGGTGSQRYTDQTTWTWSDNPVLCARDYLTDGNDEVSTGQEPMFGMGVPNAQIDDALVRAGADTCEEAVTIWDGAGGSTTQERYTCDGVLSTATSVDANMGAILGSMIGTIVWRQGSFRIYPGVFDATSHTIDEDWLAGDISLQAAAPRRDRYNAVRSTYVDPTRNYQLSEAQPRTSSTYETEDGGEQIWREVELSMVDNEYRAQRISLIYLKQSRNQQVVRLQCNMRAFAVAVHDTVTLTIDELSWSAKVFRVTEWRYVDGGGIDLTLREETSDAYTYTYSTDLDEVSRPSALAADSFTPPAPSGLAVTPRKDAILLEWSNPDMANIRHIEVWAHTSNARASASLLTRTLGEEFLHQLGPGVRRYYWILARGKDNQTSAWHPTGASAGVTTLSRPSNDGLVDDGGFASDVLGEYWESLNTAAPGDVSLSNGAGTNGTNAAIITGGRASGADRPGQILSLLYHPFPVGDVEVTIRYKVPTHYQNGEVLARLFLASDLSDTAYSTGTVNAASALSITGAVASWTNHTFTITNTDATGGLYGAIALRVKTTGTTNGDQTIVHIDAVSAFRK